ncbi:putative tubulin--tyrosine ligase [Lachnellula hyalina]|uniref:Putative tubulin--tyrosine ligase n=1 Tax=Lachnellula hyalina TaxID=1316788 RepID=A0A8H8R4A3_9HELO|nr:putative tubulin--tyrosine ligase [Lachnellula hyalina]TVY28173.1 putative tubulin--tyrosine ligase [Lachnellula hyalina]
MHILIVNDDGPPSTQSSPYVHSLVQSLQESGHLVSVVLPHTQRSWIGKAHMIGQTVKPTYFRPGTLHQDDGTTHSRPLPAGSKEQEEWVLVDGTPASCVQIGLYHYFHDRGPIDLVVSGPNYGRNSTAVFSLSSGTLGGALEAAVCKRRAIALSYAFFSKERPGLPDSARDPEIIAAASKLSVRLIEHLYKGWGEDVDLYSINVPLVAGVDSRKVMWTNMLQNYWGEGSCFKEVEDDEGTADEEEQMIREREEGSGTPEENVTRHTHKHFKWAPRFTDVYKSVEQAGPGNDGWAVKEHYTSVTPLKANFMHAAAQTEGELKLPSSQSTSTSTLGMENLSLTTRPANHFYALINYEDEYVQPLILSTLKSRFPEDSYTLISNIEDLPSPTTPFLQISSYETLPFTQAMSYPTSTLINAYVIRKALIRKHYLSTTAYNWIAKHPGSILKTNIKPACDFELDYAEFLDEALVEAWELQESFTKNEGKEPAEREWWILKPGMSDRGQGIRLFSTEAELQGIFEEWEAERPDSDDDEEQEEEEEETREDGEGKGKGGDYIVTSHLRHFIAQPYIHPPLLAASSAAKFHIRTYVLASGSLSIHVYKPMLALFASTPYTAPWTSSDLSAHLTNTCLQSPSAYPPVKAFWSLDLQQEIKDNVWSQICETTGEVFEAAAKGMMVHFQTLPNAFEVFGVDFLVDERGTAWLLEINAFPDFRQTGDELRGVVAGLWDCVVGRVVGEFFGVGEENGVGEHGDGDLVCVRKVELGRKS